MTPTQKAISLYDSFVRYTTFEFEHTYAKECALITVDELLNNIDSTILYHPESLALPINKDYWQSVRQEIEQL